ncbi:MAG: pilus assembly protein [Candidimonas sp.]|nr:MAG: pilus assembly protein [Candidimonas sp.]
MIHIFVACVAAVVALASWFALLAVGRAYRRYQETFQNRARASASEFFLFLDPSQLWTLNLLVCGGLTLGAYVVAGSLIAATLAGAVALVAPHYVVASLRRRRLDRADRQLPDFLLALAGALRAGQGMQAALRQLVPHLSEPLAQEFGLMLREQRMGVAFDRALSQLYRRVPTEGMGLVVSSLKVAMQSGGNLAETLDRIAATVRGRLHLLGRIHALTAQGRLQAWIMTLLPPGMVVALSSLDPETISPLWQSPAGWAVLAAVAVLEATGILLIRRIVRIDI